MWLYFICLTVIIVSLLIIAVIVVRKFPQLTLINTGVIPKERNLVRKREIMDQRVQRAVQRWLGKILQILRPPALRLRDTFRRQVKKLLTIDRQFRNERRLKPQEKKTLIEKLRQETFRLIEAEKFGEAEKKLIEILALDELNESVYRDLGELYMNTKRWDRAKDIYSFLAKLLVKRYCGQSVSEAKGIPMPRFEAFSDDCPASAAEHAAIAKQFANFGLVCQERGEFSAARSGFETAAAFELSNPKHLDSLVEACIMEGDKAKARSALEKLRIANPENNKLEVLQMRIEALVEDEELEE
ncbi:hypothetical protein KKF05_02875 [Patescibacteria group bacterium]|nr:hypothetical protein [Patescibacteria group bacterium]MBU1029077.1 hypothetical protein [Patescibacteria group bacterium]MBU1915860.1 hypothetical protein [Patescibacteria group bacterium]